MSFGLSGKVLVLTVLFILLGEALIWAPSISRFRKVYFEEHIANGELAAMAVAAAPDFQVDQDFKDELLERAELHGIVVRTPIQTILALSGNMPPKVDAMVDLRDESAPMWLMGALESFLSDGNRVLRVIDDSHQQAGFVVEVILDEKPLRMAMHDYSKRILVLSLFLSLLVAAAIYLCLRWLLLIPMKRITDAMVNFRNNPEGEDSVIKPSARRDEIGMAECELEVMQKDLQAALTQKARMAALGSAVTKINHDLRNSLATAMLISDRLAQSEDPDVRQITPKLFSAIDQAVNLCSQTLEFARDEKPKPIKRLLYLYDVVAETEADDPAPDAKRTMPPLLDQRGPHGHFASGGYGSVGARSDKPIA